MKLSILVLPVIDLKKRIRFSYKEALKSTDK